MATYRDTLKEATSQKSAKKLKRRMRQVDKNFSRFNDILSGSGGGGKGGGSATSEVIASERKRTRRGKRGKGGGGNGRGDRNAAKTFIENALNNPELDPKFEEERVGLAEEIKAAGSSLFELDDEAKAQFAEQLAASEALAQRDFAQQSDALLTRLFGQGRTEGELASQMGGRLVGDQNLVLQQIRAANQGQQLQARLGLDQTELSALGLRSGNLESARGAALQNRLGTLQAATGYEASLYGSDQALKGARAQAAASVKSAEIHAAASRANAAASLAASKYSTNAGLLQNLMGLSQSDRQFGQQLDFNYYNADQNAALTREGYANQLEQIRMQQPSGLDKALGFAGAVLGAAGGAGGFGALFSDERMKAEIRVIPDALEKVKVLDGVLFRWLGSAGADDGGVIAQQVERVLPELVQETPEGYKQVSYHGLIGLLIQAVKELADG